MAWAGVGHVKYQALAGLAIDMIFVTNQLRISKAYNSAKGLPADLIRDTE
jgi:hypothetical protein